MTAPATIGIPVARPKRRGAELRLLVVAVAVGAAARSAVEIGVEGHVELSVLWYTAALAAMLGAAHLAVRRWAPYADPTLLPITGVLLGIGTAMIHRLDLGIAAANPTLHVSQDARLQLVWVLIGVGLFVALLAFLPDHRVLSRYGYTAGLAGIVLLLLPSLLPASISEINGARVWVRLGPLSFQPSEIAKLLLMVFFAAFLVQRRPMLSLVTRRVGPLELPRGRDLAPVLVAWLASMLVLVRESDLGSALLFFGMFVVMLYIATERVSWLLIGIVLFAGGATIAYYSFAHVQERVQIWLHAFQGANPTGDSYQLVQGLFGFATGGVLGTGLGRGEPQIVPIARTDFIFASLGEELGLVGVMGILVLYLLMVSRGMRAAIGVRDSFGKLLAAGLSVSLALQVFVVVGGVMRVIPLTGLTLPFLSYGGSSVVSNFVLVALLIRISDAGRAPASWPVADPSRAARAAEVPA